MTTTSTSAARAGDRATSSGNSAVARLAEVVIGLFERIPNTLIAFIARFSIAAVFWNSGQTKVQGFVVNLIVTPGGIQSLGGSDASTEAVHSTCVSPKRIRHEPSAHFCTPRVISVLRRSPGVRPSARTMPRLPMPTRPTVRAEFACVPNTASQRGPQPRSRARACCAPSTRGCRRARSARRA